MAVLSTRPQSIGQVLDAGIRLGTRSFRRALALGVLAGVTLTVPSFMLALFPDPEAPQAAIATVVVALVCAPLYLWGWYAMSVVVRSTVVDDPVGAGRGLGVAGRRMLVLFAAAVVYFFVVFAGTLALVVPGVIFGLSTMFHSYRILFAGEGVFAAIRSSHRLVWGSWWRTMLLVSVIMIVYVVASLGLALPAVFVDVWVLGIESGNGPFSALTNILLTALLAPYVAATFYAVYHDLTLRKGGADLTEQVERLAAQQG